MANGYITKGIGFDIDLWNKMEQLRLKDSLSRSQYVQTAVRHHNRRVEQMEIQEIIDILNPEQLEALKKELSI